MKICDAHLHYGNPYEMKRIADTSPLRETFPCYKTFEYNRMDDYFKRLDEHSVDKTVIVPSVFREQCKHDESLRCITFAERDINRIFPYVLVDETEVDIVDKYYNKIVGVKEHIVLHRSQLSEEKKIIFQQVRDHGLILLLHSEADRRIEYVEEILKNFPGIKIQVAHMGRAKPENREFIINILNAFRKHETVFFDTSTIRQSDMVEEAVRIVGSERILYGSDFPFFMDKDGSEDIMDEQIKHILRANITDKQKEEIFASNFERLVKRGL